MGTLVRGDYLSRMLRNREIPLRLALIGVLFAFCLGACRSCIGDWKYLQMLHTFARTKPRQA